MGKEVNMADKKEEAYKLEEVPTNFATVIKDSKGEVLTIEQAIVRMLNKLEKIEGVIA